MAETLLLLIILFLILSKKTRSSGVVIKKPVKSNKPKIAPAPQSIKNKKK